jgi:nitrogen fixation/metabolism regulation signal transduction histidine kinase
LPLSLIREKLKSIQLGKKNEPINYLSNDEIGELVKEYNHKVEELAISAELLAKSERESAWREMAKQVAHEIKNPLTPMKLNIQYLQRAKAEKMENYNEFFDKVTRNLIEQIDTLSDIATEFSNFAQLPNTKNEKFDLALVLSNLCDLFEPTNNLEFRFNFPLSGIVIINSNKEQLTRAFLNLIKNSIQSIPPEQKGEINIGIKLTLKTAIVNITDNGSGISTEVQEHLFEPNFTTKTSGMGLGLSIAKNIINTCKGEIWYETSFGIGTSFFIEIPFEPNIDSADIIK